MQNIWWHVEGLTQHANYHEKITKKVYDNIIKSIKIWSSEMDTLFINSENIKTLDPQRLLVNLENKINLKESNKYIRKKSSVPINI